MITKHETNCQLVCDHCAAIVRKANRYLGIKHYYLLCAECDSRTYITLNITERRDVDSYPDCVSAWEMMDRFGRVPFHVNPLAYTQATNYHALNTFPLVEGGADAWYEIYALNGNGGAS